MTTDTPETPEQWAERVYRGLCCPHCPEDHRTAWLPELAAVKARADNASPRLTHNTDQCQACGVAIASPHCHSGIRRDIRDLCNRFAPVRGDSHAVDYLILLGRHIDGILTKSPARSPRDVAIEKAAHNLCDDESWRHVAALRAALAMKD